MSAAHGLSRLPSGSFLVNDDAAWGFTSCRYSSWCTGKDRGGGRDRCRGRNREGDSEGDEDSRSRESGGVLHEVAAVKRELAMSPICCAWDGVEQELKNLDAQNVQVTGVDLKCLGDSEDVLYEFQIEAKGAEQAAAAATAAAAAPKGAQQATGAAAASLNAADGGTCHAPSPLMLHLLGSGDVTQGFKKEARSGARATACPCPPLSMPPFSSHCPSLSYPCCSLSSPLTSLFAPCPSSSSCPHHFSPFLSSSPFPSLSSTTCPAPSSPCLSLSPCSASDPAASPASVPDMDLRHSSQSSQQSAMRQWKYLSALEALSGARTEPGLVATSSKDDGLLPSMARADHSFLHGYSTSAEQASLYSPSYTSPVRLRLPPGLALRDGVNWGSAVSPCCASNEEDVRILRGTPAEYPGPSAGTNHFCKPSAAHNSLVRVSPRENVGMGGTAGWRRSCSDAESPTTSFLAGSPNGTAKPLQLIRAGSPAEPHRPGLRNLGDGAGRSRGFGLRPGSEDECRSWRKKSRCCGASRLAMASSQPWKDASRKLPGVVHGEKEPLERPGNANGGGAVVAHGGSGCSGGSALGRHSTTTKTTKIHDTQGGSSTFPTWSAEVSINSKPHCPATSSNDSPACRFTGNSGSPGQNLNRVNEGSKRMHNDDVCISPIIARDALDLDAFDIRFREGQDVYWNVQDSGADAVPFSAMTPSRYDLLTKPRHARSASWCDSDSLAGWSTRVGDTTSLAPLHQETMVAMAYTLNGVTETPKVSHAMREPFFWVRANSRRHVEAQSKVSLLHSLGNKVMRRIGLKSAGQSTALPLQSAREERTADNDGGSAAHGNSMGFITPPNTGRANLLPNTPYASTASSPEASISAPNNRVESSVVAFHESKPLEALALHQCESSSSKRTLSRKKRQEQLRAQLKFQPHLVESSP